MSGSTMEGNIQAVKDTSNDAASCKWSIAKLGYVNDRFVEYFAKNRSVKMPIINRGYYARTRAISQLMDRFLASTTTDTEKKQVIVLGAGHDTTFFRLQEEQRVTDNIRYVECDFPDITRKKIATIRRHKVLWRALGFETSQQFTESVVASNNSSECHTETYSLVSCDIRDVEHFQQQMVRIGIDWTLPTFVLSECVLIYLEPEHSNRLLAWVQQRFQDALLVVYEQIKPHDPFGQTMVRNISARGCDLKSIYQYPTCDAVMQRFQSFGFEKTQCWDMNDVYYKFIDRQDRVAKEKLELFDEVEEYHLLQQHYCLLIAATSNRGVFQDCWFY